MKSEQATSKPRELKPEQKVAAHTLDRHVSVTAGPGAGKTFVLVERYLEILRAKKFSVDNIVAITFTNRAANEMRQRVRGRIDDLLRQSSGSERQTWLRHKRTLEGAVITTIHGFCSRLLHEFPVEANIDPQFTLLDEHQSIILIESVVEEAVSEAIHKNSGSILQFAQGTGRATLVKSLIELHRKYRDEGLSLAEIEKLTAANHATRADYDAAFAELDTTMRELSVASLSKAASEKRARALQDWTGLRAILAQPPNEKTMAEFCLAIEDFRGARPKRGTHPAFDVLDDLLWGPPPGANYLGGRVPAIAFDLLAREYSLALLKLLRQVERRLEDEKQRLSILDFDDLQLRALHLLNRPEVMARISERYKYFLVDEFQDTNGLQRDLMTKLALQRGANLFIVGDRKQSIYGFRGADVDVFRDMTTAMERAGGLPQPLPLNFRSQKSLIDAFNFLFARIFRARSDVPADSLAQLGFVEHEPSMALRDTPSEPPHVELIVGISDDDRSVDDENAPASLTPHERDAQQIAARIQSLADSGHEYRDIAILLRAFTGVWTYESTLRRAGIPHLTVQGKGFYEREEITDLIQLLRFLDNTTDELALAAVLRSPLGGISDNALLALRCAPWFDDDSDSTHLRKRNLWAAVRRHRQIRFIDDAEHSALDRVAVWLESMLVRRNRCGIADLLRQAVKTSEFMTVIAANFDGAQRIANVEKLFRLAEQFEKTGFLVRDFVHYVEEFEAVGGREGEGQMDETANVVRLMTIHQAKGLEFPIVIIPDLSREPFQRNSSFVLDRHQGLTVHVPDGRGRMVRGALFNQLAQRNRWREEFESMRLLYVAATRAEDRLILSGAISRKEIENLTKTGSEKWLNWIWQALELDAHPQSGVLKFGDDVQIQLAINEPAAIAQAHTPGDDFEESSIDTTRPLSELFPLLGSVAADGNQLRRFSVTQLINFQRCPRQYYFERMLRTPGAEERAVWNDAEAPEPPANLTATLKGAVIHRFCETFAEGDDVEARLRASFDEVLTARQAELAGRTFDIDRTEAVRALLPLAKNYLASDVFRRVSASEVHGESSNSESGIQNPRSAPGLWSELRFRLRRRLGILTGTIDKLLIASAANGNGVDVEIIDFKTNRFSAPGKRTSMNTPVVATAETSSSHVSSIREPGQTSFDFEAIGRTVAEDGLAKNASDSVSLDQQIEKAAVDYQLQMQAYALALRELLAVRTRSDSDGIDAAAKGTSLKINSLRATLHFLSPNREISLASELLDAETCARAVDGGIEKIASLDGILDADQFPPIPAAHCRICNFVDLCPAGQDRLRRS